VRARATAHGRAVTVDQTMRVWRASDPSPSRSLSVTSSHQRHLCLRSKPHSRMCHLTRPHPRGCPRYPQLMVDINRYACAEKVPGGEIEDSCVLSGVESVDLMSQDVTSLAGSLKASRRQSYVNRRFLPLCTVHISSLLQQASHSASTWNSVSWPA